MITGLLTRMVNCLGGKTGRFTVLLLRGNCEENRDEIRIHVG